MPESTTRINIATREAHWTRPHLYPKQLAAIFTSKRYAIIEASTKAGKTVGCLAWIIEQCMMGKDGHNYWWVAPSYRQAAIAYRRAKGGLTKGTYEANETKLMIKLINGTMLWFISGEIPDNLYGEDVYAAVIDEASRLRESAWHAIRSTLTATQGPIRIIGNVKGRKSWFYRLARQAQSGAASMHYAKLVASDAVQAGVLQSEEVQDAKEKLPPAVFQELYLAEPGDDSGNPFGIDAIRACIKLKSLLPAICYGVDLAKSTDWTVIIGLDINGDCCYFERFQKPWMETVKRIKDVVGHTQCLLDSTGVGDAVVEFIQRNYGSNFEGFKFSQTSKQQIMEGLALAIQGKTISFPQECADELEEFEYQYTRTGVTYSAPEGLHDDAVCALALGNHKLAHLNGGMALLRHYQTMAQAAHEPLPDKKPEAPRPMPAAALPDTSATRAYKDALGKLVQKTLCSICNQDMSGRNVTTDGFKSWHTECEKPAWAITETPAPQIFDVPDLDTSMAYEEMLVQTERPEDLSIFVQALGAAVVIPGSWNGNTCIIRTYMGTKSLEFAIQKYGYGTVMHQQPSVAAIPRPPLARIPIQ